MMNRNQRSDWLVCYDIRDPKRLRQIHRRMLGWGTPLQYSVFHCLINAREKQWLIEELADVIDMRVDDVRLYALRSKAVVEYLGPPPAPQTLFFNTLKLVPAEVSSR